jgi:hypothetical protein
MASIYKRKNEDGTTCWRAVVRIKGHPSVCNHFERKQEADDWALMLSDKLSRANTGLTGAVSQIPLRILSIAILEMAHLNITVLPKMLFVISPIGKLASEALPLSISQLSLLARSVKFYWILQHPKATSVLLQQ